LKKERKADNAIENGLGKRWVKRTIKGHNPDMLLGYFRVSCY
jgi:hypothetical protein